MYVGMANTGNVLKVTCDCVFVACSGGRSLWTSDWEWNSRTCQPSRLHMTSIAKPSRSASIRISGRRTLMPRTWTRSFEFTNTNASAWPRLHDTVQQISREIRTLAFSIIPPRSPRGTVCRTAVACPRPHQSNRIEGGRSLRRRPADHRRGPVATATARRPGSPDQRSSPRPRNRGENHPSPPQASSRIVDCRQWPGNAPIAGSSPNGVGLPGMRHRTEAIGRHLKTSSPGRGTRIRACIALPV